MQKQEKKNYTNIDYKICTFFQRRRNRACFHYLVPDVNKNNISMFAKCNFREHHHKNNLFEKIPLYMYA